MAPARPLIFLPISLLLLATGAAPGGGRAASADQTQAQLRALKERIERVSRDVGRDALERDRLARNLRTAELAVATARSELETLRAQEAAHNEQRAALAAERARVDAALARERASLATQLQVAYQIGRHEPMQLLLNQRDPAAVTRMLTWYGYFGRARATQIAGIAAQVQRIDTIDAALA